jgi:predicted S18 family serine protease
LRRNFAKVKNKIDNAKTVIVPRNQIGNINLDAVDVAQARINDMIANFDKLEEEDRVTSRDYQPRGGSGTVQSLRVRLERQQPPHREINMIKLV